MTAARFVAVCAWLVAFVGLGVAAPARAQEGVDAHGFVPVAQDGDARDLLGVQRPGRMNGGEFYFNGLFEYASEPMIVVHNFADGRDPVEEPILDDVFALNITAGVAVHNLVRIDLAMPLFFASNGPNGAPQGAGVGDMRLGAMIGLVRPQVDKGFGLGLVPYLDIPIGDDAKQLGAGGVAGGGLAAFTFQTPRITLSGDVGMHAQPSLELGNLTGGPQLRYGLGFGVLFTEMIGLNLEWSMRSALKGNSFKGTGSPSELRAAVRGRTGGGFNWLVGSSFGLSKGVGAAEWRLFVGAGFGRIKSEEVAPKIGDRDKDGFADDVDKCPDDPETLNNYKDDDGCSDELGTVLLTVKKWEEVMSGIDVTVTGRGQTRMVKSGASAATVKDLIPGAYDVRSMSPDYEGNVQTRVKEGSNDVTLEVFPTKPGTLTVLTEDESGAVVPSAEVTVATPGGGEGIGASVVEGKAEVRVPPGSYTLFVQAADYGIVRQDFVIASMQNLEIKVVLRAARASVKTKTIDILEKVFFEVDSDVIKAQSYPLLEEVASILLRNPDVLKVEVAGHTDSDGSTEYNQTLSERRVQSVVAFLVERGVADYRLHGVGYGESKPIDSNDTAEGKGRNRRVEFNILERK